ncbi:hypothetical protein D9758_009695 [Tetrapyrgos nigripes]|uniref:Uncharacterized protein n=1 Tax=Tetrapyrgos nigripes TaxID=182062 RepID=A0A8H5CR61_9AGAR|nr:hypothetical protein D9758_009695 [Tetrapyrgos nigripes]
MARRTTNKMGTVRLELQRIREDVMIKNSRKDITDVEVDKKPSCVFIFKFVKVATGIGSLGAGVGAIKTVGKGKKRSRVSFEQGSDDEHLQPSISPMRKHPRLRIKSPRLPPPPSSDHDSDEEDEHGTETETDESDTDDNPGLDDAITSIPSPKPSLKIPIPSRGKDFVWKEPRNPTVANPNSVRPAAQPRLSSSSPLGPQVHPSSSLKSKLASRKRDLNGYRALLSSSPSSSSPGNPVARRGSKNSKSHALPETSHSPTTGSSLDGPVGLATVISGLRTPPKPQEGSTTDDSTTTVPVPLPSSSYAMADHDARPVPEAMNSSLQAEMHESQIIEPSATGSAALAVAASPFFSSPLVPVSVRSPGSARTSCTIDGALRPISADLGARIHELEEANQELVKETEQQMELENELAEVTKNVQCSSDWQLT